MVKIASVVALYCIVEAAITLTSFFYDIPRLILLPKIHYFFKITLENAKKNLNFETLKTSLAQ